MTIAACAALVEKGDPDRYAATMAAPVWARELLFPLYAFNLEIARIPWASSQPLVAEMRLQWWRDMLAAAPTSPVPAHEIAAPLHGLIRDAGLPVDILDRMVAARRWDCWSEPFAGPEALASYLDDTGGALMWLALRALGAPDTAEPAARAYGRAAATAAFLRAAPVLVARGRHPLPQGLAVETLARQGLDWLQQARAARALVPKSAAAALLAGWQSGALLQLAATRPETIADGGLQLSEFSRRGRLLWQAATGRW